MIFSYNWLKNYLTGKVPSPALVADKLTKHSFEVEELKKKGSDYLLDIDVLPNRAGDCFSHIGVSREIATLFNLKEKKLERERVRKTRNRKIKVLIIGKNIVSRYSLIKVSGIKVKESPKWIKDKITSVGLQPINNIVDITNFLMLELGQPAHAFDFAKIQGKEIKVRLSKKGEKIRAIGNEDYQLNEKTIVITDAKKPIAIAGTKGGEETAISNKTEEILIELANFNKSLIRSVSKNLKLKTDASWRFENGIDPNLIDLAIERLAFLLKRYAGAKSIQLVYDFYPKKIKEKKITFNYDYLNSISGSQIKKEEVLKILKKLGFMAKIATNNKLEIIVPPSRLDIKNKEDIAEEVWRIFGYDKIKETPIKASLNILPKNEEFILIDKIKDFFISKGFNESYNYSFISEEDAEKMVKDKKRLIQLANPMSSLYSYVRPTLIINLLKTAKENLKNFPEVKIFEIGNIFEIKKGSINESTRIGGIIKIENKENQLFLTKKVVGLLFEELKISQPLFKFFHYCPFHIWQIGESLEILVGNEMVGIVGELIDGFSAFELDFQKIKNLVNEEYSLPIKIPQLFQRDISVVVNGNIQPSEIISKIRKIGGKKIKRVEIFDIYQKDKESKKISFRIIYQINKSQIKRKDIEQIHKKVLREFKII